jgi:cyclophilin family peptidyl-prolyl cis-trans isomerase
MSKATKRGTRRNPPQARRFATIGVVIALLVAGGFGAYYYATRPSAPSSTSFSNTPCPPSSSTATTSGSSTQYALICTNLGTIEVELYPQYAPKTVANFVSLANSGFYNDLVFHRIVPGFVIQVGDPNTKNGGGNRTTWGQGTSGTSVPFENATELSNTVGTLAMASTGAGVGGSSQFYINLGNNAGALDGKYAVFGQVISGMNVVNNLAKVQLVDSAGCSSGGGSSTACEPANAASAYIVSVTIQSTP